MAPALSPPSPPNRRPTSHARREQILREATLCFASNGFRGTTTREIAAAVGITEAALYRHFPSKQAIYDALIDQKIAAPALQDTVSGAAARRDDRAVFEGLAKGLIERGVADPNFLRLFFFTALEGHELADRFFKSRVGALRGFITDYIQTRISEGAFREGDASLYTRAFLGMVWDYYNVRVIFGQHDYYTQPIDAVAETFVDIFLGGVSEDRGDARRDP